MSSGNARVTGSSFRKSILILAAAAALPTLVSPMWAQAQVSVTWDNDGISTGAIVDGAGAWDTTLQNFWNGATNVAWNNANNDIAVFGAGTTGGLITVTTPITVGGINVNNTGYIIGASASNSITFAGSTPTLNVGTTSTMNAPIGGASAITVNIASTATLNLGSFCTASNTGGFVLTGGGTLAIANGAGVGGTLNNGAGTLSGITFLIGNTRTVSNAFFVSPSTTSRIWSNSGANGTYSGTFSGTGIVDLGTASAGSILTVSGNNAGFSGTFNFTSGGVVRYSGTNGGSSSATFDMGSTGRVTSNGNNTIQIGALTGLAGSGLYGHNSATGTVTYSVGALGIDSTFAGGIFDGGNATLSSTDHNRRANLVKVGAAKLTLTGVLDTTKTSTGITTINGGTLAITNTSPVEKFTSIAVNNGTAAFDVTGLGTAYVIPVGQTMTGSGGTAYGDFTLNATTARINPGTTATGVGTAGTISFANKLTLNGGTVNFDLTNNLIEGGGANDLLTVGNLDVTAASKLVISPITAGTLTTGTYRLINYTTASNIGSLSYLSTAPLNATLDTSIAGQVNLIVNALGNPQQLRWNGPGADWDLNTNTNFFNTATNVGTVFFQGDSVTFDDTPGVPTTVNLSGVLSPGTLIINSSTNNYTFSGSGAIAGNVKLVKQGTSTLAVNTANTFSGGSSIDAGTVLLGNSTGLGTFASSLNGGNLLLSGGIGYSQTTNVNNALSAIGGNGSFSGAINVNVNSFKGIVPSGQTMSLATSTLFVFPLGPATMDFGNSAGTLRFALGTAGAAPQGIGGNLIVDLGTGSLTMNTRDGNSFTNAISLAGLAGGTNTIVRGSTNTNAVSNYAIGGVDITTVFNGSILNGTVSGSPGVNLTKLPIGTLVLNGNSSTTGTVVINDQGTLIVNGQYSGGGAFTVDGTLGGIGNIAGPVTVNNRIAPGNSVGKITTGALTLNNAQLDIEAGSAGVDHISANGALTTTGTSQVNLSDIGGAVPGRYMLIDYTGAALADLTGFNLNGASIAGTTAVLANNSQNLSVDLIIPNTTATDAEWSTPVSGDLPTNGNWSGGTAPSGVDTVARFGPSINGAAVALNAAHTLGSISFASTGAYTIGGSGSIDLNVTAGYTGVSVTSGSHSINVPILASDEAVFSVASGAALNTLAVNAAGQSVRKAGGGQLTVASINPTSLNVVAGTLQIAAGGSPNTTSSATVIADTKLNIASAGTLDLTNNALIIDYTTLGSNLTNVRGQLAAGRIAGSGLTDGMTVGYANAATVGRTSFAGVTLPDTTAIIIGTLYAGDANFDGKVNTVDFNQLAGGFGVANQVWTNGDFNYTGTIDSVDFNLLAANYGKSMALPGPTLGSAPSLGSVVPEPTVLSAGVLAMSLLMRRRRDA